VYEISFSLIRSKYNSVLTANLIFYTLRNLKCNRLASSSKDGTIRVWDTTLRRVVMTMSQHTAAVTCIKWGGDGLLYSSSRDKTIKVWNATQGNLISNLEGHGHWVNTMALSTDFVLRTGAFDHTGKIPKDENEGIKNP